MKEFVISHAYMPMERDDKGEKCDVCNEPQSQHLQDVMFKINKNSGAESRPNPLKTD